MEEKQSQELDMLDIMSKCKDAASCCYDAICSFVTCILRLTYGYKFLFLIALIAAGALSYYMTSGNRRVYKGDLALKVNAGTSYMIADLMEELNEFVKYHDTKALSEALNISEDEASNLCHIKSYYYIAINKDSTRAIIDYARRYELEDTLNTRVKDKLVVSVGLKDRDQFAKMQSTITSYINSNAYLKDLHELHVANLKQKEQVINCDLNRLDSLQSYQFFKNKKQDLYLTNMTELRTGKQDLFYNDKLCLLDKRQSLEDELAGNNGIITVMSPFHPTAVSSESFIKKFLVYGCAFYILFLICTAVFKNRKKILDYLKEE
ncbi:MAG: hypothetical protein MJZ02_06155 [Paludibacteraceae bacterium]|nr:hypothetical protein [Paludibacteraceae bacterium]